MLSILSSNKILSLAKDQFVASTNGRQKIFYITPAHVAIYSKDEQWCVSNSLSDLRHLNWKIPKAYIEKPSSYTDLCWCEESDQNDFTESLIISNDFPIPLKVDVYFRQPRLSRRWCLD